MNSKYQIDRLKTNDKNFPKSVTCIIKDKRGFMWFGTHYGLYRFDGYNFKVFYHKNHDNSSISSDNITCICDDDDCLWIGTGSGLNRFNKTIETFKAYSFDSYDNFSISSNHIWSIHLMKSGELWIGTRVGIIIFDKRNERFYCSNNSSINLIDDSIISFCEDSEGSLWIGTGRKGLIKYDIKNNNYKNYKFDSANPLSLSNNRVMELIEDNNGYIWIATWGGGINKFDKKKEIFLRFQHDTLNKNCIIKNEIICMSRDEEENFWCATPSGISIFDPFNDQFTNLNKIDYPVQLDHISYLYSDYSGITWIYNDFPAERSINIFSKNKQKFNHYKKDESDSKSLTSNVAVSICDDDKGNILIGSDNGIDILDKNKEKTKRIMNLGNKYIWNIYRDKNNYIWLTTYNDALERYDQETGTFTQFYDFDGKGFICHDILEDKKENLWLGLMKGGVRVFDKNRKLIRKYLTSENGNLEYRQIEIRKIFEDSKEDIWIATNIGLALLDQKTDTIFFYKNIPNDTRSINCNIVLSMIEDEKGYLWVGTRYGGLNRFDPETKTFKYYIKGGESGFNAVRRLLLDNKGNIWMVTEKSIAMFNPNDESFTNYDESDGVQGLTIAGTFKSKDGEMFFGGENGFNSFYPDNIPKNKNVPTIVLTDFRIFNKEAKFDTSITDIKEITISYKENFFSFDYAALDYTNPGKNQYAYKLEGVDKDWNYVMNKMTASYTDISPGEYTFRVKGSNNDGVWNEEGISVRLIITPPWYETIWFKGFAAVSLVSGAGFMYGQRIEKLKKGKRQQEEFSKKLIESQENERKRVAAELHDSLGQDLLIIKNKALISIKKTDDVIKFREQMNEISELTTSTINEVREISYNLRPYELDRLGLLKTLQALIDRANKSTNISFNCDIDNIDKVFSPEVEINIYRIVQECLTNIIKHSEAIKVVVRVKKLEKEISIFISDNGKGFNVEKKFSDSERKGFGLKGIPERVKLFGGSFDIESEPGTGTRIKIIMPVRS